MGALEGLRLGLFVLPIMCLPSIACRLGLAFLRRHLAGCRRKSLPSFLLEDRWWIVPLLKLPIFRQSKSIASHQTSINRDGGKIIHEQPSTQRQSAKRKLKQSKPVSPASSPQHAPRPPSTAHCRDAGTQWHT